MSQHSIANEHCPPVQFQRRRDAVAHARSFPGSNASSSCSRLGAGIFASQCLIELDVTAVGATSVTCADFRVSLGETFVDGGANGAFATAERGTSSPPWYVCFCEISSWALALPEWSAAASDFAQHRLPASRAASSVPHACSWSERSAVVETGSG